MVEPPNDDYCQMLQSPRYVEASPNELTTKVVTLDARKSRQVRRKKAIRIEAKMSKTYRT